MRRRDERRFKRIARLIKRRYRSPEDSRGERPTFQEFVKFLIDPRTKRPVNRHWMPFYKLCRPCKVHYDFIGHLETLNQDISYVLKTIGFPDDKRFHIHKSRVNSSSLVGKQVATLSHDQLTKLTDIYRLDFLLFGYSTELPSYTQLLV